MFTDRMHVLPRSLQLKEMKMFVTLIVTGCVQFCNLDVTTCYLCQIGWKWYFSISQMYLGPDRDGNDPKRTPDMK